MGATSFEMQTCGDSATRYWIGLLTVFAPIVLAIFALWRFGFGERTA